MNAKIPSFLFVTATIFLWFVVEVDLSLAGTPKDFFQNQDLNDGNNYLPPGTPTDANDVLLTTSSESLFMNATDLAMESLNQTNNMAYVISNNTSGSTNSTLTLGNNATNSIGGDPGDLIYLGGATSSLTIQGSNGGSGSGVLNLNISSSSFNGINFDVAQAGATLNISANLGLGTHAFTKTGAGTLNLGGVVSTFGGGVGVNDGTVNILPSASLVGNNHFHISVNNSNTGVGSDVALNVQTSISVAGLNGTVATPSSGTNTATVNLVGAATQLSLSVTTSSTASYAGTIAGSGSVSIFGFVSSQSEQTFSGNNTYSGTTSVTAATLRINGTTSGQGDYNITPSGNNSGALAGTGTIGLQINRVIRLVGINQGGSAILAPGAASGIGTLHVIASGTGAVIFGDASVFAVDIGAAGSSDLLAIAGGSIDLTSSTDTLSLSALAGAFDGSSYTIATFDSNIGANTFNNVMGLPGNYVVSYTANSIMLLPVPEPSTWLVTALGIGILVCARRFI